MQSGGHLNTELDRLVVRRCRAELFVLLLAIISRLG
jgi:hypothetical protein